MQLYPSETEKELETCLGELDKQIQAIEEQLSQLKKERSICYDAVFKLRISRLPVPEEALLHPLPEGFVI